ncbi:MAG: lycopene cyclase domain-containing protein [Candidatus Daviesbacteria bacterium]|nr:lycopene cyclase domain-containing protein [Candidatus Daviesbacteria bacterium]
METYKFAYLIGTLSIGLPIWLVLFLLRYDIRHKILLMSILGAVAGPISEYWYIQDYWRPQTFTGWPISIEDVLFGFFAAGIASVIYEELFGKRYAKRHTRTHHHLMLLFPILVVAFYLHNHFNPGFSINSIYASSVAFLVSATAIILNRKDLLVDSVISGLLFGAFFFLAYQAILNFYPEIFIRWWLLQNITGVTLLAVPIEEIIWGFTLGMFAGPLYEFYSGLTFKKGAR